MVVGLKHGIAVLHTKTGYYEYLAKFDYLGADRLRTNDGAVGPDGSLWFGTMPDFGQGDPAAPEGAEDEDGEEASRSYGGSLFRMDVGTRGLPAYTLALDLEDSISRVE